MFFSRVETHFMVAFQYQTTRPPELLGNPWEVGIVFSDACFRHLP